MKDLIFIILLSMAIFVNPYSLLGISNNRHPSSESLPGSNPDRILKVPEEFKTIALAIEEAKEGDWVIISPGNYSENKIEIKKSITVSSEWKLTGDFSIIEETIIDSEDEILFSITADGVEISGLHIINGNHTLDILSKVTILHNHFVNNLDAISFEGPSGGYIGYNTIENDRDDGIDLDIGSDQQNPGSNVLIEHNTIINSNDDGIEIRLFRYPNQNIEYIIRENTIIGSKNAGIQIISYDVFTGKEFHIHHNIFQGNKTGLGCMEGSNTVEDLSGASKMDELVYFFNNTLVDNQMAATGGNNIIAVNNLVQGNSLGGFKRFGKNSAIINNLFFMNGGEDFIELNENVTKEKNLFSVDPLLDKNSFRPAEKSPVINAGIGKYELKDVGILEIPARYITGTFPNIGAIGKNLNKKISSQKPKLIVDAGEDGVVVSPANEGVLNGKITSELEESFNYYWKLEKGPGTVDILFPDKIHTKVKFHQNGIYQFSLISSDDKQMAMDKKTIRYIHDGEGKKSFLNEEKINIIEAEDYSYSYGNVSVIDSPESSGHKHVKTEKGREGDETFMEYSVGTSENVNIYMWLLVKNQNSTKSDVQIQFNNQILENISVSGKEKWEWVKIPGKINTAAGQWPVLIKNDVGTLLIDKILFSFDQSFIPHFN
ncbi:MAG TPA: right-handed parallel beta-helix repeat-containing protein [Lunatimonas sp.]|nr:right-handed parallel beta-helix repeat-containing protein [Lunatimonas sp.]